MCSTINQKEYLKKYLCGDKTKKSKKKRRSQSQRKGINLIDDCSDISGIPFGFEEEDEAPTIAEITYEDENLKVIEQFKTNNKWKNLESKNITEASFRERLKEKADSEGSFEKSFKLQNDKDKITKEYDKNLGNSKIKKDSFSFQDTIQNNISQSKNKKISSYHSDDSHSDRKQINSVSRRSQQDSNTYSRSNLEASPFNKRYITGNSHRKNHHGSDTSLSINKDPYLDSSASRRKGNYLDSSSPSIKNYDSNALPSWRRRHDSDASPQMRKRHDSDASPQRRKRHDSNASPQRRKRHDSDASPQRRTRHDSDASPQKRKRHDSNVSPQRRHDSDASPQRRTMHDSDASPQIIERHDSDVSPQRRKRHNSDASPQKKKRHDSDISPTRNLMCSLDDSSLIKARLDQNSKPPTSKRHNSDDSAPKRHDSDASPPRKSIYDSDASPSRRKKYDSDASPPRRIRHDSDASPPRRKRYNSYASSPRRKNSFDNSSSNGKRHDSDASPPRKNMMGADHPIKRKNNWSNEESNMRILSKRPEKNMTTADYLKARKFGKLKKDTPEDIMRREREAELQKQTNEMHTKWNKGMLQGQKYEQKVAEFVHEAGKSFARQADDIDMNDQLKNKMREEDPMLEYIMKKKVKEDTSIKFPIYTGSFPPNRFNIRPGYRWDGVDRSTGYEKEWFSRQNSKKATDEESYKWSIEDM